MQSEQNSAGAGTSLGQPQPFVENAQRVQLEIMLPKFNNEIRDMPQTLEELKAKIRELLQTNQPFKIEYQGLSKKYIISDDDDLLMAREYALESSSPQLKIYVNLEEAKLAAPVKFSQQNNADQIQEDDQIQTENADQNFSKQNQGLKLINKVFTEGFNEQELQQFVELINQNGLQHSALLIKSQLFEQQRENSQQIIDLQRVCNNQIERSPLTAVPLSNDNFAVLSPPRSQTDSKLINIIQDVTIEQQEFQLNYKDISFFEEHDEEEFQKVRSTKLFECSKVIEKAFPVNNWYRLRIKDLQHNLRRRYQKTNKANFEVFVKCKQFDGQRHQSALRFPSPEFEDIKLVYQMQRDIVVKSYIQILISIQPDFEYLKLYQKVNGNTQITIDKKIIIQLECDPVTTTLAQLIMEFKSNPKYRVKIILDDKLIDRSPFDQVFENKYVSALVLDFNQSKTQIQSQGKQVQKLILKDKFNMTLNDLKINSNSQIEIICQQQIHEHFKQNLIEEEEEEFSDIGFNEEKFKEELIKKDSSSTQLPYDIMVSIKKILTQIEHLNDEKAVILFGNTGCGKSTLILSMVYGSDALQEMFYDKQIRVIDLKPEIKKKLDKQFGIQIGNDLSKSKTFIPKIEFLDYMVFVDIAGLKDTGQTLIEYVNRFILRCLFQKLKEVKFILPIQIQEFTSNKANGVKEQLEELETILGQNINNMLPNIIPIVTKCNPRIEQTLDRDQMSEMLEKLFPQIDQDSKEGMSYMDQQEADEREDSVLTFIDQLMIYDPLERKIKCDPQDPESEVLSVCRRELLDKIHDVQGLDARLLELPMSDNMLSRFYQSLESMRQQCIQLAHTEKENALKLSQDPQQVYEFKNIEQVQKFCEVLEFFDHHKLIKNAGEIKLQFERFIQTTNQNIFDAMTYSQFNQKQRDMYHLKDQIQNLTNDILSIQQSFDLEQTLQKCESLVQKMKDLQDSIENLKQEIIKDDLQDAQNHMTVYNCQKAIYDTVEALINSYSLDSFFIFGYQLRKMDTVNDKYTKVFLDPQDFKCKNEQALKLIVASNVYFKDNDMQKMQVKSNYQFNMMLDQQWRMLSSGQNNNLFIQKDKKDYHQGFQFLLTKKGVEIGFFNKDNNGHCEWLRLTTSHGKVLARSQVNIVKFYDQSRKDYQKVKLTCPSQGGIYRNPDAYRWKLEHNEKKDKFYIYLDYQDYSVKPRLMSSQDPSSTIFYSKCIVSTQQERGYGKSNQDSWEIVQDLQALQRQDSQYNTLSNIQKKQEFQSLSQDEQQQIFCDIGNYLQESDLQSVKPLLLQSESFEMFKSQIHSKQISIQVQQNLELNDHNIQKVQQFYTLSQNLRNLYDGIDVNLSLQIFEGSKFKIIENLQLVCVDDYLKDIKDTFDSSVENPLKISNFSFFEQFQNDQVQKSNIESIQSKEGQVLIILYWNPLNNQSIKMVQYFNRIMEDQQKRWKTMVRVVALCQQMRKKNVPKIIDDNRWNRIEFFYCNHSQFVDDYGIISDTSIVIVDQYQIVAKILDNFDSRQSWALDIQNWAMQNQNISGSISKVGFCDIPIDISIKKSVKELNAEEASCLDPEQFQNVINIFKEQFKQNQQLEKLLENKEKRLKAAQCKFSFEQLIDSSKLIEQDYEQQQKNTIDWDGKQPPEKSKEQNKTNKYQHQIKKQFNIKIMLQGERVAIKEVQQRMNYLLEEQHLKRLLNVEYDTLYTDKIKARGDLRSFHWNSMNYIDINLEEEAQDYSTKNRSPCDQNKN